jgi:hypothetical protein
MNWRVSGALAVLALLVLAMVWTGVHLGFSYVRGRGFVVGELQEHPIDVPLDGARLLDVDLGMVSGALTVTAGADGAMDGRIRYNIAELAPTVDYAVQEGVGRLSVLPPTTEDYTRLVSTAGMIEEWELHLGASVPISNLVIARGVGDSVVDLRGLALRQVEIELVSGRLDLNLDQPWSEDATAAVTGASGHALIRLPQEVEVQVHAVDAFGRVETKGLRPLKDDPTRFVHATPVESPATLHVIVDLAFGTVRLVVE